MVRARFFNRFLLLGASSTAIGRLLLVYRQEANLVGGLIVILFGAFMTGLMPWRWFHQEWRFMGRLKDVGGSRSAAYLLGLAFAFGWTPALARFWVPFLPSALPRPTPGAAWRCSAFILWVWVCPSC